MERIANSEMPGQRGPVPVPLHENGTGRDLTLDILYTLETTDPFQSDVAYREVPQDEIKAALDRLRSRQMVEYDTHDAEEVRLSDEGLQIATEGSHEYRVWELVKSKGQLSLKDPALATPSAKVGQGNAFKLKWIKKDGDLLVPVAESVKDNTRETLKYVQ